MSLSHTYRRVHKFARLTAPQQINFLRYYLARPSGKRGVRVSYAPTHILIVVGGSCTLHCDMCWTHSTVIPKSYANRQNPVGMMTFEYFRKVIDSFRSAIKVNLIGAGEPFLNPDIFKMIGYAAERHRMVVATQSNGTIIADKIDTILNSRLYSLGISVDGDCREEFVRMTGNDPREYDRIVENVQLLTRKKKELASPVLIYLSFIIDKINYSKMPAMIRLAEELGVNGIYFLNFLSSPYPGFTAEERSLFAEDREIFEAVRGYKQDIKSNLDIHYPSFLTRNTDRDYCCDYFFRQIVVDPDGNYGSCSVMLLNNLRDGDLFEGTSSFNGQYIQHMRRLFLEQRKSELPERCHYCPENAGVEP